MLSRYVLLPVPDRIYRTDAAATNVEPWTASTSIIDPLPTYSRSINVGTSSNSGSGGPIQLGVERSNEILRLPVDRHQTLIKTTSLPVGQICSAVGASTTVVGGVSGRAVINRLLPVGATTGGTKRRKGRPIRRPRDVRSRTEVQVLWSTTANNGSVETGSGVMSSTANYDSGTEGGIVPAIAVAGASLASVTEVVESMIEVKSSEINNNKHSIADGDDGGNSPASSASSTATAPTSSDETVRFSCAFSSNNCISACNVNK